MVSGDRDLLQLADEHIKIRIPRTSRGVTEIKDYFPEDVLREYQVTPEEFIDVKALMGDCLLYTSALGFLIIRDRYARLRGRQLGSDQEGIDGDDERTNEAPLKRIDQLHLIFHVTVAFQDVYKRQIYGRAGSRQKALWWMKTR